MGLNLKDVIANLPPLTPEAKPRTAPLTGTGPRLVDLLGVSLSFGPPTDGPHHVITVITATFTRDASLPLQRHPEPVTLIGLSGTVEVFADAPWQVLAAGDALTIPADTPHAVRNASSEDADVLIVAPDALARFLEAAARPMVNGRAGTPTDDDFSRFAAFSKSLKRWAGDASANAAIGLLRPVPR